jgi:hypothetical protein
MIFRSDDNRKVEYSLDEFDWLLRHGFFAFPDVVGFKFRPGDLCQKWHSTIIGSHGNRYKQQQYFSPRKSVNRPPSTFLCEMAHQSPDYKQLYQENQRRLKEAEERLRKTEERLEKSEDQLRKTTFLIGAPGRFPCSPPLQSHRAKRQNAHNPR